ncbi:EAL domain-containing protein [Acidovorax sp. LjRoot74]|uniref:putative bifunctional diguanylate cyclase/phosphodiesterase n=1 Tax=Acidovorax sp. LjRoot74 TaxID=3342337 RepID=UPI003ECCC0B3
MVPVHDLGVAALAILGVAFLIGWSGARLNQATLLWGIAHLSLAGATFTGYRYHLQPELQWLGVVATLLTGFFLASLHGGTNFLRGRIIGPGTLIGRSLGAAFLIAVVGIGGDEHAASILVLGLKMLVYGVSAYLCLQMHYRLLAVAFALKTGAFLLYFLEPSTIGTPFQDPAILTVGWISSVLLGLVLVDAAIAQTRMRLSNVIKHLPDALVARRLDGKILFCNDRFAQLAGRASPSELEGQQVPLLTREQEEAEAMFRKVNAMVRSGPLDEPMRLERSITPARGEAFPAEIIFSSYMDLGYPVILGLIRDLSERKRGEEERLHQANTDQLTGLPNRRFLEQQLDAVLWIAQRQHTQCAVLLIDLDHFKKVNDTLGHAFGDEILRDIAQALRDQLKPGDLLARLSGDEFALVMAGLPSLMSILEVEARALALLQLIRRQFKSDDMDYQIEATIGVAFSGREGLSAPVLLQRAEVAMYESKARGRGGWCFFESDMDERLAESLRLESALRQAVPRAELRLHYQPIYSCSTGRMAKAEALVRWESPQLGWVPPGRFIPAAEESSLILELGQWILEEAIRQAAQWRAQSSFAPVVSINVSVRQFAQPGFESQVFALLDRYGLPPSGIELELTETLLASDQENLPALLHRLHDAGVGLSLDDFGTGYSSLSYLSRFSLNTVKIDRSFVMGLQESSRNHSLVRAIISMAHSLHLNVVAEGVETWRQYEILKAEGCDYQQGYLLGRPMAAEQLRAHPQVVAGEESNIPDAVI